MLKQIDNVPLLLVQLLMSFELRLKISQSVTLVRSVQVVEFVVAGASSRA
jgi:hypothetical protein